MMIITNDGITFNGTPEDIVGQLRKAERLALAQDTATYMADVASRVRLWNGAKISFHDAPGFLAQLKAQNLIDILEP